MNCANHPDRERVSFCQNCGKPLCLECIRTRGGAIFCEPCYLQQEATANGSPSDTTTAPPPYTQPQPSSPGGPNPSLAALLGFIPGVGAMYNGQYAKGIVHLIVFAILTSLSDRNGLFILFVFGWVFYQVIEAYHTARARRDGTPLPNPFGLNDIGEKLGFGRAWPAHVPPAPGPAPVNPPSSMNEPYGTAPIPPTAVWTPVYEPSPYTAPVAPIAPEPPYSAPESRFPAGAVWLIGLGLLFFLGSTGLFRHFPIVQILPFLIIGVGVWVFVHRMTSSGFGLADDGTSAYRLRLVSALRGSIWIILTGVLFFLDSFNILSWAHSWPLFIITAGVMMVLQRSAFSSVGGSIPYGGYPPPSSSPYTTPVTEAPQTGEPHHPEGGQ